MCSTCRRLERVHVDLRASGKREVANMRREILTRAVGCLAICGLLSTWPLGQIARGATPGPITVVQTAEPTSLDPISNTLQVTQNVLEGNVFEALVVRKDNMVLAPGLATAWRSVSPTTWEFDLRHGVKFQNGEPFDANSVVFTLQTILDPKNNNPFRPFLDVISSVTKVDDFTVRVETKQPYAPLVASLYPIMMLPPKAYQDMGSDAFGQHPIGTGPYDLTEWVKDDHITLRANPGYWNGAQLDSGRRVQGHSG